MIPLWKVLQVLDDRPTKLRVLVKERTKGPLAFSLAVGRADPTDPERTLMFLQFGADKTDLQPLRNAMDRLLCEAEKAMSERVSSK